MSRSRHSCEHFKNLRLHFACDHDSVPYIRLLFSSNMAVIKKYETFSFSVRFHVDPLEKNMVAHSKDWLLIERKTKFCLGLMPRVRITVDTIEMSTRYCQKLFSMPT